MVRDGDDGENGTDGENGSNGTDGAARYADGENADPRAYIVALDSKNGTVRRAVLNVAGSLSYRQR